MPDIIADLHFLADITLYEKEKPYNVIVAADQPEPKANALSNITPAAKPILIKDFRPRLDETNLRDQGFQLIRHKTDVGFQRDWDTIAAYKAETECMLKEAFDADFVLCWDYKARTNDRAELPPGAWNFDDSREREGVSIMPHNDHTLKSGPLVIKNVLSEELQSKYLNRDHEITLVNTWRPILDVIEDQPLAVCDARSVDINDLIPCDRIVVDRLGEIYLLRHNPDQQWYWLEHQMQDEVLVFVTWTSEADGRARTCLHTSFENSRSPEGVAPRQSLETRSVIIKRK